MSTSENPHPMGFDQEIVTTKIVTCCLDQQGRIDQQAMDEIKLMIEIAVEHGLYDA